MKKITQETERKLLGVIEKTAGFVNEGDSPNDAIVKAASAAQLRPGEVNLVVHAYNTGRTTRQRQEGDDPFTKAASFDLADASVILEELYPTQVKSAAAISEDTTVSPEYSFSPRPMLERKTSRIKAANDGINWRLLDGVEIETPEPLPTDPNDRLKVAMSRVDRLRLNVEEARRKKANAFGLIGDTFDQLTTYFRRPDAKPMPVVKEAVIMLHGDKGEQVMDQLVKVTPQLEKMANHCLGGSLLGVNARQSFGVTVDDLDCTAEPFPMVEAMMGQIADYKEKSAALDAAELVYDTEAGEAIAPFVEPAASPSILGTSSERVKAASVPDPLKTLGTYSIVKNTMWPMAESLKGPSDDDALRKTLDDLNDPSHEAKLRGINTQAMLQDLMLNDPVIAGYDPNEVTNAYNDIVQVSPSVGDQRMLMQSLLRKQLQQGQLDTFEQDQLLGFEDKLRKQQTPVSTGTGDGSVI